MGEKEKGKEKKKGGAVKGAEEKGTPNQDFSTFKKMPAFSCDRWKEQQPMCRHWILSDPPAEATLSSDGQGVSDILSQTIHSKYFRSPKSKQPNSVWYKTSYTNMKMKPIAIPEVEKSLWRRKLRKYLKKNTYTNKHTYTLIY